MPAYLISYRRHVHDAGRLAEYSDGLPPVLDAYGGRLLILGGEVEPVEIDHPPEKIFMIEFPSFEAAKAFYYSDEYQRLSVIRQSAADADVLLVDGYEPLKD